MKVLIADDSIVFRSQIKVALDGVEGVIVIGSAPNGKIAVDKISQEDVDLLILDVEMPEMNGLEALRELRRLGHRTKVIMFSSHTKAGAEITLEALSAGAQDFVTKPSGDHLTIENAAESIRKVLLPKIQQFMKSKDLPTSLIKVAPYTAQVKKFQKYSIEKSIPSVLVIGSSTGGPSALEEVLRGLQGKSLRCPVLITQHMPPVFTASLAARIEKLTNIPCAEGRHLEILEKKIYIAPGDFHMSLSTIEGSVRIVLDQGPQRNSVRPAVDSLFETASEIYKNRCVGIVLTGMGSDGAVGAVSIKENGGGVVIQDRESCVVFGMPLAVYEKGAYDVMGNLSEIRELLIGLVT